MPIALNTDTKKALDKRIRKVWDFYKQHNIRHNITIEDFEIVRDFRRIVKDKQRDIIYPDNHEICPVAVFNDRAASIGGRFYSAFWIGMPKELRPLITIDGLPTADIDGCAMHVQLLYQRAELPVPDVELYIYPKGDERRKITKMLMLYMINTRKDWPGDSGRVAVIKTYKKHQTQAKCNLMDCILELEKLHHGIRPYLYKSNWGNLQHTEAQIILKIMLAAMKEGIVVLPVHDGCLCQRKHRSRVLEFFADNNIVAKENKAHLHEPDFENMAARMELIRQAKAW